MTADEALAIAHFTPRADSELTESEKLQLVQLDYFRKHLDVFLDYAFAPIKLKRIQKTICRAVGQSWDVKIACSRGIGKTWLIAFIAFGLGVLYPGTVVRIVSASVAKATETINKIKEIAAISPSFANEIKPKVRSLVTIDSQGGECELKNGSIIESSAIMSLRSRRAKIIIRDEEIEIDQDKVEPIVSPVLNYIRPECITYGLQDYDSKTISITSCCDQGNGFFNEFMKTYLAFQAGKPGHFACCLDYHCAIDNGINLASFFDHERERITRDHFAQEYGSFFLGNVSNTVLPYSLTSPCRVLRTVELAQPKDSTARYVIGLDIATSAAKGADNSIIVVIKFREREDGYFSRKLVYMQSFHGKGLDVLAKRVQELYHIHFPRTEAVVFDARGVGDAFALFCNSEYIDLTTGKEYPPLAVFDDPSYSAFAKPVLHPFRAVLKLNQQIYGNLLFVLERRLLEMPVSTRDINDEAQQHKLTIPPDELDIFEQADELQREMSHIIRKTGAGGDTYDTPSAKLHKDRYSALAMANDYITELEKSAIKGLSAATFVGDADTF